MAAGPTVQRDLVEGKPIYWYSGPPAPIKLKGMSVTQKGKTFFLVKGSAVDIDRLCRVPVIPYDRDNDQIAAWVLSPADDKWQRTLDPDRVKLIDRFFQRARSFLVNSAVLSVPSDKATVSVAGDVVEVTVPVTWLVKACPSSKCRFAPGAGSPHFGVWFDACPECDWDGRPGIIVDGQHRIRGTSSSGPHHWNELLVATLLMENQFSPSDMAKIFTEITTSAVDLDPLHKLFLLYRFELVGRKIGQVSDADFTKFPPAAGSKNTTGLRNRRAYEVVCTLCKDPSSRWHNRVTILPSPTGNARRGDVIDADRALAYVEEWLRRSGVLADPKEPDGMLQLPVAVQYLQDYVEALLTVWPKGVGTSPGTSSYWWNDLRNSNGVLEQRGIFEVFVQFFPTIVERVQALKVPVNKASVTEQLSYVEDLDWNDPAWSELGSPDKNKNMLLGILKHIYAHAPNPVNGNRLPSWVNNWIRGNPDGVKFTKTPGPTIQLRSASKKSPIRFVWESTSPFTGGSTPKPLNAFETGSITIAQMQGGRPVTLLQEPVRSSYYDVEDVPSNLDKSAKAPLVTVQVTYNRGNVSSFATHTLSP